MGLGQLVERMFRTITPGSNRVGGSTFLTHIPATPDPAGTAEGVVLTPGTAIGVYGNYAAIATAKVVPTECWIEAVELRLPVAALGDRLVGIITTAAVGAGAAANMEAQVGAYLNLAAPGPGSQYIPLRPPIYVRAATAAEIAAGTNRIMAALAAAAIGNKCSVKLTLSHQK